jgi:hypothetical protein
MLLLRSSRLESGRASQHDCVQRMIVKHDDDDDSNTTTSMQVQRWQSKRCLLESGEPHEPWRNGASHVVVRQVKLPEHVACKAPSHDVVLPTTTPRDIRERCERRPAVRNGGEQVLPSKLQCAVTASTHTYTHRQYARLAPSHEPSRLPTVDTETVPTPAASTCITGRGARVGATDMMWRSSSQLQWMPGYVHTSGSYSLPPAPKIVSVPVATAMSYMAANSATGTNAAGEMAAGVTEHIELCSSIRHTHTHSVRQNSRSASVWITEDVEAEADPDRSRRSRRRQSRTGFMDGMVAPGSPRPVKQLYENRGERSRTSAGTVPDRKFSSNSKSLKQTPQTSQTVRKLSAQLHPHNLPITLHSTHDRSTH